MTGECNMCRFFVFFFIFCCCRLLFAAFLNPTLALESTQSRWASNSKHSGRNVRDWEQTCSWHSPWSRQERLLRNKRRWVLSTIELKEEDPGPYPKPISKVITQAVHMKFRNKFVKSISWFLCWRQVYNNLPRTNYEFRISGQGVDEEPINTITVNPETGEVSALRSIDREQYGQPFHVRKLGIGLFSW